MFCCCFAEVGWGEVLFCVSFLGLFVLLFAAAGNIN